MHRYFTINASGCSISCKLYGGGPRTVGRVVLYGHGFGGHKETRAAERFADHVISRDKQTAVLTFDWPCHGSDVRKKLTLDDCDRYLSLILDYLGEHFASAELFGYATSFGAYLFLKYVRDHGNPFRKLALRCPAVSMYRVITENIISEEELAQIQKGKEVSVGFDRKIRISRSFLESLQSTDIRTADFTPYCDDLLILHGTKDEIVPFSDVEAFAGENSILFLPVENADHRFQNPAGMMEAIKDIESFFEE